MFIQNSTLLPYYRSINDQSSICYSIEKCDSRVVKNKSIAYSLTLDLNLGKWCAQKKKNRSFITFKNVLFTDTIEIFQILTNVCMCEVNTLINVFIFLKYKISINVCLKYVLTDN